MKMMGWGEGAKRVTAMDVYIQGGPKK